MDWVMSASLLENLKLEDPWLPPNTWESIPRESGLRHGLGLRVPVRSSSSTSNQNLSTLSVSFQFQVSDNTSYLQLLATSHRIHCSF